MIKLKDILNEDEVEDNFGKVAFGENPKIAKMQGKVIEKDTEFEKELLDILFSWVRGANADVINKLFHIYPVLKKASVRFPEILKPQTPNGTRLYRGLSHINENLLAQLSKTTEKNWSVFDMGAGKWYVSNIPIHYTPRKPIQSWTSNFKIATTFTGKYNALYGKTDNTNSIVISTSQNDEYLLNQKVLSHILKTIVSTDSSVYGVLSKPEQEVLHFGTSYSNDIEMIIHTKHLEYILRKK